MTNEEFNNKYLVKVGPTEEERKAGEGQEVQGFSISLNPMNPPLAARTSTRDTIMCGW
jgi:hypothetical protein